ncbi:MAG TPA: SCP2 sterol-binding domain-containing protein [Thermoplasmata archaeon]|jgi:putative sterol carrier protein|nr:SCP2 sterol-binding domain-containing protein [Thermoplasmata archaeon]
MQYFSMEFFEELARRLNGDAEWKRRAESLTARLTLTVTDRSLSFLIEIANGTVSARSVQAEDSADFKFEGPWQIWAQIAGGQTDFNTAVLTGKMKFRGSLPKIMGIQPQMTRLTQVAKEIPATSDQ